MNIIQVRDRLKGVRDSDLVNYVKNPTADVPSFVALSEIKRRKDDRTLYAANQNMEKKTVAEDLTNPTDPQALRSLGQTQANYPQNGVGEPKQQPNIDPTMLAQSGGIVGLNPTNVGQFAEGGIIGFDGETGSLVRDSRNRFLGAELGYEDGPVPYPLGTAAVDALSYLNPLSYLESYNPRIDPVSGRLTGGVGDRFADTKAAIESREIKKRDILDRADAEKTIAEIQRESVEDVTIGDEIDYTGTRQPVTDNVPDMLRNKILNEGDTRLADTDITDTDITDAVINQPEGGGLGELIAKESLTETIKKQPGRGIKDIVTDTVQDTEIFNKSGEMRARNQVPTEEAAIESSSKLRTAAGLSDDPFSEDRAELRKDRKALKDEKSNAGNMALISAGLLWAKDGNIGDAEPAVRKYAADLKGLRGEARDLKKIDLQLKGATVAMKEGQVKSAGTLIEAAKKRLDTIDINELNLRQKTLHKQIDNNLKLQIANLQKDVTLEAANITAGKKGASLEMFNRLSKAPEFQTAEGKPDALKIMKTIKPATTMYPGASETDQLLGRYFGRLKVLEETGSPELQKFLDAYPSPEVFISKFLKQAPTASYTTQGGYTPAGG